MISSTSPASSVGRSSDLNSQGCGFESRCRQEFLSRRNALRRGYSNAAVVPCVRPSVSQSVSPSVCHAVS